MTATRLVTVALVALLLSFHFDLWFGKRSLSEVSAKRVELEMLQRDNAQTEQRNRQMRAEVEDLKKGKRALEEKARFDLGMVKPGEVFVQYLD